MGRLGFVGFKMFDSQLENVADGDLRIPRIGTGTHRDSRHDVVAAHRLVVEWGDLLEEPARNIDAADRRDMPFDLGDEQRLSRLFNEDESGFEPNGIACLLQGLRRLRDVVLPSMAPRRLDVE